MNKKIQKITDKIDDLLSPREKQILKCRYIDKLTLQDTGKKFDITAVRVGQIIAKAMRKINYPNSHSELLKFFEGTDEKNKKKIACTCNNLNESFRLGYSSLRTEN